MMAMIDTMPSNMRSFRVDDELWTRAQETAKRRGEALATDVLRPALERYVERFGEELEVKPWLAFFHGFERVGVGSIGLVMEGPGGVLPHLLVDPKDSEGKPIRGRWAYDGKNTDKREAYYVPASDN